jgi:outer membrane protein TolC
MLRKNEISISEKKEYISRMMQIYIIRINDLQSMIETREELATESKASLDMVYERFKAGNSGFLDVSDAEVSYEQAEMNYYQSVYDLFLNCARLKHLVN